MTDKEFETINGVNFSEVLKTKETIGGIDFYTLPISTNVCINDNGNQFVILKPYKQKKRRERAIAWALEQFEKNTLKHLNLKKSL